MTKATKHETPALDSYPKLAAHIKAGGEMKLSASGGLWYVTVIGARPDLSVTMASSSLDYALRQADTVVKTGALA